MVRAGLASKRRIGQGPRVGATYAPAATVVAASALSTLPIVATSGWFPDAGFLTLIAWRLLRSEPWPGWWAAPLGLVNDLFTGAPLGLSIVIWAGAMLALDILDRRTMWRDYWVEWVLAALLIMLSESAEWYVAGIAGAPLPYSVIVPALLISVLAFPLVAWLVSRIDRWRLGQ